MPEPQRGGESPADEPTLSGDPHPPAAPPEAEPTHIAYSTPDATPRLPGSPPPRPADPPEPDRPAAEPTLLGTPAEPAAPAPAGDRTDPHDLIHRFVPGSAPVRPRGGPTDPDPDPVEQPLPPPPPHNPTLVMPVAEQPGARREPPTPVDPWAGADQPDPWPASLPALPQSPPPAPASPAPPPNLPAVPAPPPLPPPRQMWRFRRPPPPPPPRVVAMPPGWRPPPGYVAVAVRRKRRWPWVMAILALLTVACCCACPWYYGKPYWDQYPASVSLPAEVADLSLRDDATSRRTAQSLELNVRAAHLIAENTFAAVYGDRAGKRATVFGAVGLRWDPEKAVDEEIVRLTEVYHLTAVRPIATADRGHQVRCATGTDDGADIVLCSWADHGSLGTGLFTRRSIEDSADLLATFRTSLITRG